MINSSHSSNDILSHRESSSSSYGQYSQISETRGDLFLKKAACERKNLIYLTRLIVKDLISSSISITRTIDDCSAIHLKNYFVLIERALKHGLKDNVFSGRFSNLWNTLESLPKFMNESTLIAESVRSLAHTKTSEGKVRAWIRLAMMQKKLPEYFNELLANKEALLKNVYHDYGFMLNEEAHIFAGLIIGVNVIDCNFFIKDSNFDIMDDVIDLGSYLRYVNGSEYEQQQLPVNNSISPETENGNAYQIDELKSILDQKNYLEERNKCLENIMTDLHRKIKSLEDQNSRLEMEAKLNEARITKLQQPDIDAHHVESFGVRSSIRGAIKNIIGNSIIEQASKPAQAPTSGACTDQLVETDDHEDNEKLIEIQPDDHSEQLECKPENDLEPKALTEKQSNESKEDLSTKTSQEVAKATEAIENRYKTKILELEKEVMRLKERTSILETSYRSSLEKIKVLEADLDVQTSMNADKETTMRIYEKDLREKQAQVDNLRNSMDDAKKLNSNLNERLTEATSKLKDRINMVTTLQTSLDKWKLENKNIAIRLQEKLVQLKSLSGDLEKANKTIEELKQYNIKVTDELKNERESGQCSTYSLETQQKKIDSLVLEVDELKQEVKSLKPFKVEAEELNQKCRDYELSLEEMGNRLRESRLEIDSLKENTALFTDCQWMDDKQVKECNLCRLSFSVTRRKHHCRLCGNVFCQTCSDNKMELASSSKPVRVCDTCHSFLLAKFVKSASTHPT